VAAIGKRRADAQKGRRRESGMRARGIHEPGADSPRDSDGNLLPTGWVDGAIADAGRIENLLDQTSERLLRMTETPLRRELSLVVERYRRALREWGGQRPTPVQQIILFDCVKALHDRVVLRSRRDQNTR
jgi:hypothetical protein